MQSKIVLLAIKHSTQDKRFSFKRKHLLRISNVCIFISEHKKKLTHFGLNIVSFLKGLF